MHAKFIKHSDDIQFNKTFIINVFFNDFFYQWQTILISLCFNVEFSIIDAKLHIFVNSYCE